MKRVKILAVCLTLTLSLSGCSDFLSEVPDNRTQIDSPKKIKELLAFAYPQATHGLFAEMMTDNILDTGNMSLSKRTSEESFLWQVVTEDGRDTPEYFWMESYKAIAQANAALGAIEELDKEYENRPTKYNMDHLKGEALLSRAYNHFMLVNLWAKTYNPQTADSDLGVPYVLESEEELIQEYHRASVAEVYELIEKDLLEGIELIDGVEHVSSSLGKYHFTEASANAFAARFYLYKGEFDKVLKYSTDVAGTPVGKLRQMHLYSNWDRVRNDREYGKSELTTNLLVSTSLSNRGGIYGGDRFAFTTAVANRGLFGPQTHPMGLSYSWNYPNVSFSLNDRFYVPKFFQTFKIVDFTNMAGLPYVNFVLFSNDMLFLDRIEAAIMLDNFDEAVRMLEYFVWTRTDISKMGGVKAEELLGEIKYEHWERLYKDKAGQIKPFYNLSEKQAVLIAALAETRRREGFEEGYRWFDIRRYNLEIEHKMSSGEVHILTPNDNRKQMQIPLMAIDKGIIPNPR